MGDKKKGRRAYLEQFRKNESGEYTYQGKLYIWKEEKHSRKSSVTWLCLKWAVLMAAAVANGCIPAPGMGNTFYVLIPYAGQVVAEASLGTALFSMIAAGNPLREYQYEAALKKVPLRAELTAAFSGVSILAEIIFLIREGAGEAAAMAVLFLVLGAVAAGSALLLLRQFQKLKWEEK